MGPHIVSVGRESIKRAEKQLALPNMLFTWRKNKGILGKSQEVFTVFTKQK